jgi:hypothetical protein
VVNDLWRGHVREILTASFVLMLAVTLAVFPNRKVRSYMAWDDKPSDAKMSAPAAEPGA